MHSLFRLLRWHTVIPSLMLIQQCPTANAIDGYYQQSLNAPNMAEQVCDTLHRLFPSHVSFPNDSRYEHIQSKYWSVQQAELIPSCRFFPSNAQDTQVALQQLSTQNVSFAIVSGGNSSVTGASNIDNGVTLDLSSIADIQLNERESAVWLGVGARWADVYAALEPHGLTVSGRRVADVGVGGYVLGGGLSWFANQYGWTCDSVLEFEVVTPDAKHLFVSASKHNDLFWALKGSLGAVGVVTRIKLPTIQNKAIYGGAISYDQEQMPALFKALETNSLNAGDDLHTQGYISFGWIERYQAFGTAAYIVNTKSLEDSAMLSDLLSIPHIHDSLRKMTLRESATEIGQSNLAGFRRSKFTLTTRCDAKTMSMVHEQYLAAVKSMTFDEESLFGVTMQPLTIPHLQAQDNLFELLPKDGPLLLISFEIWWDDSSRDTYFEQSMLELYESLSATLRQSDSLHAFVYPNYAAKWQDPLESLGDVAKERLAKIKQLYDPEVVWRRLVPGVWHV